MKKRQRLAWLMWGIMIITYMLNTFHAVAMGVIRQDLIRQFSLSESQYVQLTNAFSYTYMLMQIPAGILLDRIGARKISFLGNLIAAMGALLFSQGDSYLMLLVGRSLIGLGCSVCFLSVLKICSQWFEDRIFCTMSGVTCFVGMMGAAMAQAPLAALQNMVGWRTVFLGLFAITALAAFAILLFVKDTPAAFGLPEIHPATATQKISLLGAVKDILKNKATWPPFVSYGCFYGTYLLMTGLYGTSMLQTYYKCTEIQASSVLTLAVFGCATGSVVIDWISDRFSNRRHTQFFCGIAFLFTWILLRITLGNAKMIFMYPLLFLFGFFSCAYAVCWSCVKECNNPSYTGISTSIANIGGYLGSILVPTITGSLYSQAPAGSLESYHTILTAGFVITLAGVISAWFVRETGGKNIYDRNRKR